MSPGHAQDTCPTPPLAVIDRGGFWCGIVVVLNEEEEVPKEEAEEGEAGI